MRDDEIQESDLTQHQADLRESIELYHFSRHETYHEKRILPRENFQRH